MKQNTFFKTKTVLITCGPTWVPIDDVRVISNISSGEIGNTIAMDFAKAGAKVTLLEGPVTHHLNGQLKGSNVRVLKYFYYKDLHKLILKATKKNYDYIVHAAAVSDYQLRRPFKNKLSSRQSSLKLDLTPTKKLISVLRKKNPKAVLIGFKLVTSNDHKNFKAAAAKLVTESSCDFVIVNRIQGKTYYASLVNSSGDILFESKTKSRISTALLKTLKG